MDVRRDGSRSEPGLVSLVTQVNKAVHRLTSEELLGMRFKPYLVLGYVGDHPGATQQELESALFMDANSVVLILNELEAAQFSVRRRDSTDRRRHIVEITAAGRRALERADRARESLEDEVMKDLSAEERKVLRRLLERVLLSLSRVRTPAAAAGPPVRSRASDN